MEEGEMPRRHVECISVKKRLVGTFVNKFGRVEPQSSMKHVIKGCLSDPSETTKPGQSSLSHPFSSL